MSNNVTKIDNVNPSAAQVDFCKNYEWIDCWKVRLPKDNKSSSYDWAQAVFSGESSPKSLTFLMNMRNKVMKPFNTEGAYGTERIGSFPLLKSTDQETILGKNDRHLSFSVSIRIDGENKNILCTTIMKTHNTLGRVYWFFIGKCHPMIIKIALQHAVLKTSSAS